MTFAPAASPAQPSRPPSLAKIVLTGGPGAGKSTAARHIAAKLGRTAIYVPEAATQVYERMGRKWSDLTLGERRGAQEAMYRLQLSQEAELESRARDSGATLLLLDRGTIDGAGYWPDGSDAFWSAMGTTHRAELDRYHAVIWLETAASLGLYDHDASNAVRFESAPEAIAAGQRMADLWRSHRNLLTVRADPSFEAKLVAVEQVVLGTLRAT